jgi:hypothetical protein
VAYARYVWAANRIEREDMKRPYYLKQGRYDECYRIQI